MRPRQRRSGITMTEVLVAIFVCGLGLMALMTLFPLGAMNMAQAIKDDRCGHAAANATAIFRSFWRVSLESGVMDLNLENQLRTLAAQGIDPRSIKLDWNKVRETQKDKATRDVKASLLLDKIGDREAIAATQDEVDKEVQKVARQQRQAVAVTRAKLQKDGSISRIAGHIRTEKTLNFLFEQARKEAAK